MVDVLLDIRYLSEAVGRRLVDVEVRIEKRPGCTLAWIKPHYLGAEGPRRLLLKVGGRDGDLVLYRRFGERLPAPTVLDYGMVDGRAYRLFEVIRDPTLLDNTTEEGLVLAAVALAEVHRLPTAGLTTTDATAWLWAQAREAWSAYRVAYDPPGAHQFERLLDKPPPRPGPWVVCHGDAHAGNFLLGTDRARLIDWEDWRFGPGVEDLAFLLGDLDPERRAAWSRPAFDAYVSAMERPRAELRDELDAALDQLPKMVPFWHAGEPTHESVTEGLQRQWAAWVNGIKGLGIS
jgi:hypothetical protein